MLNFKELNKVNEMSKNEFTKWLDENFECTGCEEGLYFKSLNNENINFTVEFTMEGVYEYFKKTDKYKNFCDECLTKEQIEEYEDMLDKGDFRKLKKEYEFEPELKEYYAPISVLHDMVDNFYLANDNFLDYDVTYFVRDYIIKDINKAIKELVELGEFDSSQMEQIARGFEDGLDISMYADPKFDWEQMKEIRLGLKEGLDVSKYADPKFDWEQMLEIRESIEKELDISTKNRKQENTKKMMR